MAKRVRKSAGFDSAVAAEVAAMVAQDAAIVPAGTEETIEAVLEQPADAPTAETAVPKTAPTPVVKWTKVDGGYARSQTPLFSTLSGFNTETGELTVLDPERAFALNLNECMDSLRTLEGIIRGKREKAKSEGGEYVPTVEEAERLRMLRWATTRRSWHDSVIVLTGPEGNYFRITVRNPKATLPYLRLTEYLEGLYGRFMRVKDVVRKATETTRFKGHDGPVNALRELEEFDAGLEAEAQKRGRTYKRSNLLEEGMEICQKAVKEMEGGDTFQSRIEAATKVEAERRKAELERKVQQKADRLAKRGRHAGPWTAKAAAATRRRG